MNAENITITTEERQEVRQEQLRLMLSAMPQSTAVTLVNGCILGIVQYPVSGIATTVIWFAVLLLVSVWRLVFSLRFDTDSEADIDAGHRTFFIGTLIAGVVWGSSAIWLFPQDNLAHEVFVAFVIAGMTAGAMTSLAYRYETYLAFALPALFPLAVYLFLQETLITTAMGTMVILYMGMVVIGAKRFSSNYIENIILRLQSDHRERARRESEERYRSVFEYSPLGIVHYDDKGIVVDCNQQYSKTLGIDLDQLLGLDIFNVVVNQDILTAVRRSLMGETAHYQGAYQSVISKKALQVNAHFSAIKDSAGDVIGGVVLMQDLTESEEVKTQLESTQLTLSGVLDTIPVRVFWKNAEGIYLGCNRLFSEDAGFNRSTDIIGKTDVDFSWDDELQSYRESDLEVIQSGEPVLNFEEPRLFGNGDRRWFEISKVPFYGANGAINGVLCAYQDITERKLSDEKTQQARDEAEAANKAKSEFLSSMSHELRTPLNAILGFAQVLSLGIKDDKQQLYINHILDGGQHLLELITQLLDLSRIESGKLEIEMQPVHLQAVMTEALLMIAPQAEQMQLTLTNDIAEQSDLWIQADPLRLKQTIINLLSNAVKYNNESGWVRIYVEEQPEGRIRIFVQDGGPGIAEEHFDQLFQAFVRVSADPSRVDGSGIGLPITKYLVEMMDGEIGLESEVGKGSTFWCELNLTSAAASEDTDKIQVVSEDEVADENRKLSLFYLEDNPSNMTLVQQIVAENDLIDAHYAMHPVDGLKKLAELDLDLILLDINLPEMDGYEVLERVQEMEHLKDVPVIAVSANAMKSDISRGLKAGFDDYMTKPLNIQKFQLMLEEHVARVRK